MEVLYLQDYGSVISVETSALFLID